MPGMSELGGEAFLRINRAIERFQAAWQRGTPPPLEELIEGTEGVERDELLKYALAVELEFRRRRGEMPTSEEYERWLPAHPEIIRGAFATEPTDVLSPSRTTDLSLRDFLVSDAPGPDPGTEPLPGRVGKYVVLERLRSGGQGSALLARDPDLERLVVLKRYHAPGDPTPEARALCRVRSRYTAQCYSLERHGDALFVMMEYIPGRNLAEVLEQGPLAPDAAARLIEHGAEGLEAVHACGLLHRDLKPSNIIMGDDGVPRLADFGLAAHLGSTDLDSLSGTPPYMAPEQARRQCERIDARTDLYGLGAVLYALLTGQPPHPGQSGAEALAHARRGLVTSPRVWNRSIPRPLDRLVMRALAADPAQRFASVAEFRQALRRYRHRHSYRAAAGLAVALALGLVWAELPRLGPRPDRSREVLPRAAAPLSAPSPVASPLSSELLVRVWSVGGGSKRGWRVDEPGTLPVLPGEQVHLEARLSRPAYAYLFWLDGKGQAVSLYPWRDRAFHSRPSTEVATTSLHSPAELDLGWPMEGPGGLETALLLVRETPLPPGTNLADLIGQVPAAPLRDLREVDLLGFDPGQPIRVRTFPQGEHRSLGGTAKRVDDPLPQLMERLRPHFDGVRAVRFAYRGE
jgi:hypothetical protein